MIRWKKRIKKMEFLLADMICILLAFFISNYFFHNAFIVTPFSVVETSFFLVVAGMLIPSIFNITGVYDSVIKEMKVLAPKVDCKMLCALALSILLIASILFFVGYQTIEPRFVMVFGSFLVGLLIIERILMRLINKSKMGRVNNSKNIIIVGNSESGKMYIDYINKNKYLSMKVVGYVHIKDPVPYEGVEHLGELENLPQIAANYVVDEIAVSRSLNYDPRMKEYLTLCQDMGITVTMLLECHTNDNIIRPHVAMVGKLPVLKFHSVSLNETQLTMKKILDFVGSSIGLIIFAIAFVVFGPIIKLETPGPIIFKQKRVGKNGRVFEIWKFRSMGIDAEKQKYALMDSNEMSGHMFKLENDPRVTKIGAFMRKTSIDELPQFVNVFKGDMSLVGTRPPTVDEVSNYELKHHKRISISPGITGKWQVSGRSNVHDFEEVVRLDSEYINNWTIYKDVEILFKTIIIVLTRKGSR